MILSQGTASGGSGMPGVYNSSALSALLALEEASCIHQNMSV